MADNDDWETVKKKTTKKDSGSGSGSRGGRGEYGRRGDRGGRGGSRGGARGGSRGGGATGERGGSRGGRGGARSERGGAAGGHVAAGAPKWPAESASKLDAAPAGKPAPPPEGSFAAAAAAAAARPAAPSAGAAAPAGGAAPAGSAPAAAAPAAGASQAPPATASAPAAAAAAAPEAAAAQPTWPATAPAAAPADGNAAGSTAAAAPAQTDGGAAPAAAPAATAAADEDAADEADEPQTKWIGHPDAEPGTVFAQPADYSVKHPLHAEWTLWYDDGKNTNQENWGANLVLISKFSTIEDFWCTFNNIPLPGRLPMDSNFHLFKNGIKPEWEDENNKNGGKYLVTIPKQQRSELDRQWRNVVLAIVGETFMGELSNEVTGVVASIRRSNLRVAVWTRTAGNEAVKNNVMERLKAILLNGAQETKDVQPNLKFFAHADQSKRGGSKGHHQSTGGHR